MSLNLYDLLDVDESATRDEIRAAWKTATADLDPTDRRFRAYNDAAAVLLDDDKRAAYDAELAAGRGDDVPVDEAPVAEMPGDEAPVAEMPDDEVVTEESGAVAVEPADETPVDEESPAADEAAGVVPEKEPGPTPAGPPLRAVIAAAVLALLSVIALVVVLLLPGSLGGEAPKERAEQAIEGAKTAENAAAEMVPVVLAYDYRTLEADLDRAGSYLTDDFAAEREKLFASSVEVDGTDLTFREQVVAEKLVVSAAVSATGLTRISESGEVATVVVYVDQESQKGEAAPQPLKMWATLTLERDGERWLLDDICTEQDCDSA